MDMFVNPEKLAPLLVRLKELFGGLDREYDRVAGHYGLSCEGCAENCCSQRFFHHTTIEYFLLKEGMGQLKEQQREKIIRRAHVATESYLREVAAGEMMPLTCPANFDGLCALYEHRPMICRAHGLPHEFRRPDGVVMDGGGCHRLELKGEPDLKVDRTVTYAGLAGIEREMRGLMPIGGRYRKTTAEMLMDMAPEFLPDADFTGEGEESQI